MLTSKMAKWQNGNVATDNLNSNNTIHGKQKTAGGFIWKI